MAGKELEFEGISSEEMQRPKRVTFLPEALPKLKRGINLRRPYREPKKWEEFKASLAKEQLEPIGVRKDENGSPEVIYGNNRLDAILEINEDPGRYGLPGPIGIDAEYKKVSRDRGLQLNYIENKQRFDHSPVDEAEACFQLGRLGWDQKKVAAFTNHSQSRVSQLLSLREAPDRVLDLVHVGKMPEAMARALTKKLTAEEVETACARIEADEQPAMILRDLNAKKRERGARVARSDSDLKKELVVLCEQGSDRAGWLLLYKEGDARANEIGLLEILEGDAVPPVPAPEPKPEKVKKEKPAKVAKPKKEKPVKPPKVLSKKAAAKKAAAERKEAERKAAEEEAEAERESQEESDNQRVIDYADVDLDTQYEGEVLEIQAAKRAHDAERWDC
jgi:hypothetical protein